MASILLSRMTANGTSVSWVRRPRSGERVRDRPERLRALPGEAHRHVGPALRVVVGLGVADVAAEHDHVLVARHAEHHEARLLRGAVRGGDRIVRPDRARRRAQDDGVLRLATQVGQQLLLGGTRRERLADRVDQPLVRLRVEGVPLLGRRALVVMRVGAVLGRIQQRVQARPVGGLPAGALRDDGLERAGVVEHEELAGRADDAGRGLRILDPGERDGDLVVGLLADLRLTHAELVDARADDRDRLVDLILRRRVLRVVGHGLQNDLEAASQIQAEHGGAHDRHNARQSEQDEHGQQDQVILGSVGHATPHSSRLGPQVRPILNARTTIAGAAIRKPLLTTCFRLQRTR